MNGYDINFDFVKNELDILKDLRHTNISFANELYHDKSLYYLITDLYDNGTLLDYIVARDQSKQAPL